MNNKISSAISKSRRKGGDDFDIVERASIDAMIPRIIVKSAYDRIKKEELQRKAS